MQSFISVGGVALSLSLLLVSCAELEPKPFVPSTEHVKVEPQRQGAIPELVKQAPVLTTPDTTELEKYTVVVNEVPVKELLFALARDAELNVDIDPAITGVVTINAVDQNLLQILNRISRQVALRYEFDEGNLYIQPESPFLRVYTVDYVNLSRNSSSSSSISTQISSASSGSLDSVSSSNNNSTTDVSTKSEHHFWSRLISNISAILGEQISSVASGQIPVTEAVIPNPESGIISVMATTAQHEQIQSFIELVLASAKRQVLIQITIVEVTLNKRYQAGVDWSFLDREGDLGVDIISTTLAGTGFPSSSTSSSFVVQNADSASTDRDGNLMATVRLLDEFGDTKILSSPQMMVLNNQTALLKVVENLVYFEIDAETTVATATTSGRISADTTAKIVPVGIVMVVTPQIDANGTIILSVRPTISRLMGFVDDPNPELAMAQVKNPVPQIAVREMESVLRLVDGQIGVLGGLMTDETVDRDAGIPGLKDVSGWGNLFKSKSAGYSKTELVIFLKPTIIHNPDVDRDLNAYKHYLDAYGDSLKQPVATLETQ